MTNPWLVSSPGYPADCEWSTVADRTDIVRKETNLDRLQAYIDWPGTEQTVRVKAWGRLRRLTCEACMQSKRGSNCEVKCCLRCRQNGRCNSQPMCQNASAEAQRGGVR